VDDSYNMNELEGKIITDTADTDMSGALIFATKQGTGQNGTPVRIAACWGQNPAEVGLNRDDQDRSLDLGTVVLPFPTIKVSKTVELLNDNDEDGKISPGDDLLYRIRVSNVGQVSCTFLCVVSCSSKILPQTIGLTPLFSLPR
jgi:hypothetical protein